MPRPRACQIFDRSNERGNRIISWDSFQHVLSRLKVFDRPFFKKVAGAKGSALGRARRRETFHSPFLVLFAAILPKRTEKILSMLHVLIHSILFFDTAGAKKRIKRNAVLRGVAGCLLDDEFRRNSSSGGVNNTRNTGNIHTPPCFSEKSDAKTFVSDNRVVAVICSGLTRLRARRGLCPRLANFWKSLIKTFTLFYLSV